MGQTAIISPQILDSTSTGRDLITSVDAAAGRTVLEIEDASYNWSAAHVFEGGIESAAYNFTAGQDGQLNHPDLASSIYVRFNNADVFRFNALDFWPVANGTKNLGRSDHEWANVYSVAGAFSGTVTANAFVGDGSGLTNLPAGGNPFDQDLNTTDSPSFVAGTFSGSVSTDELLVGVTASTSGAYDSEIHNRLLFQTLSSRAFTARNSSTLADVFNINTSQSIVTVANDLEVGNNGSFSGNLVSEVGGSLRMFSLGTDGDADTESLDIEFDALNSKWEISTNETGSGLLRQLWFDASQYRMYESGNLLWIGESNEMRMYGNIVPSSDGNKSVGIASKRFRDIYAVNGDFSGDVIMAANVDFTGLPTADPVVAGRLWNDSGTLKISAG